MFVSSKDGKCEYVNGRWCDLTGLTAEEALGDGWARAIHPEDAERVMRAWAEASAAGRDSVVEYRFLRPDEMVSWIEGHATVLRGEDQSIIGWVGTCLDMTARHEAEDISDRKQTEHDLRRLADHDSLTGLLNRRGFMEGLRRELRRMERKGEYGALLLLDLDNFKLVNDSAGHPAGDEVLRTTADVLRRRLRTTDVIGRFGGDEFAALILNVTRRQAREIAEETAEAVRAQTVSGTDITLEVTASIGVVAVDATTDEDEDEDELLAAVDRAMYHAKGLRHDR